MNTLINKLAQDIIDIYGLEIPIRDIDSVVEKLGGHVCITSTGEGIRKHGDGFVVCMNPFEKRKNFLAAHELGHLFLHMGYKISPALWNSQENTFWSYAQEREANAFATALLMPAEEYKKILDQNTNGSIVETRRIAEYFGVSVSEASERGRELGYLQDLF